MRTGERAAVRLDIEDVDELLDEPSAWMRPAFRRRRVAMPEHGTGTIGLARVASGQNKKGPHQ